MERGSHLDILEKEGFLDRIHGGAVLKDYQRSEYSFSVRATKNIAEKMAIGKKAAELVEENQCILLDSSSTALELLLF